MTSPTCTDQCSSTTPAESPAIRRALWIALIVNLSMFFVEIIAGWGAGSVSLLADAVDFFGDAANYALSLFVLSMGLAVRAKTALLKGWTMGAYGAYVLGQAVWNGFTGVVPEAVTMGGIGILALIANVAVALFLYVHRGNDANLRSVWLCSRNDAIGNLAIVVAAAGVFGTNTAWPDLLVALIMALLGLSAARTVIAEAKEELKEVSCATHA